MKPRLRRTPTPERADREFERMAPLIFRRPAGLIRTALAGLPAVSAPGASRRRVVLYIHGGAFVTGSPRSYAALAGQISLRAGAIVAIPDYPRLQQAPFPAAPEACRAAWDALIGEGYGPGQIALAGDSAGGSLLFGLLAQLLAEGARPAAVFAMSPFVDLTGSGATVAANRERDPLLPAERLGELVGLYLQGADPADPAVSPVFADYPNPPPVLVHVGSTEILRSDAETIAARTGGELKVYAGLPHVWHIFCGWVPEAGAALDEAGAFLQTSFESASR